MIFPAFVVTIPAVGFNLRDDAGVVEAYEFAGVMFLLPLPAEY